MKRLLIVLLCAFTFTNGIASKHQALIQGEIADFANPEKSLVFLKIFDNGKWITTDSALVDNHGNFEFVVGIDRFAFLKISYRKFSTNEIFVDESDSIVLFKTDSLLIAKGNFDLAPSPSSVNYLEFLNILNTFNEDQIIIESEARNILKTDSFALTKKRELDKRKSEAISIFNKKLSDLKEKSSKGLSTGLINNFLTPQRITYDPLSLYYDNDAAFYFDHYFDYIDFSSKSTLNSPYFWKKLDDYFKFHVPNHPTQTQKALSALLQRCNQNKEVLDVLLNYFINKYASSGDVETLNYISEKHINGCTLNLNKSMLDFINSASQLKTGQISPEIVAKNINGKYISLHETCKSSKYTILLFVHPKCSHCNDAIDLLASQLKTLNNVSVYLFSLDSNSIDSKWSPKTKTNWIEVSDKKGWDSEYVKKFLIYRIPHISVLDNQARFLAVNVYPEAIPATIMK